MLNISASRRVDQGFWFIYLNWLEGIVEDVAVKARDEVIERASNQ